MDGPVGLGFARFPAWFGASDLVILPQTRTRTVLPSHPFSSHATNKREKKMWRNWDTAIGLPSLEKVYEHSFNWVWSILLATDALYMQYFVFKHVFFEGQD